MSNKILITDYVHPKLPGELKNRGYDVVYEREITMEELKESIGKYHGIIINSKIKMYAPMIDLAKNLKFIGRLGSGMEIVDIPYAKSKGIHVFNTPSGNCNAVAEHAMGMLLCLANNIIQGNKEVKNFDWNREKNRGFELEGKTVGIIGFGHTGKALASKLFNWGVNILAHDKYVPNFPSEFSYVTSVSKEEIQKQCDIISFHLPLTPETKHYVADDFIEHCKDDIFLINTSRGQVIRTESLLSYLENGKVKGACLDVFENEKVGTYTAEEREMYARLYAFDNVIVTPHVAGWTHESLEKITDLILVETRNVI